MGDESKVKECWDHPEIFPEVVNWAGNWSGAEQTVIASQDSCHSNCNDLYHIDLLISPQANQTDFVKNYDPQG